MSKQSNSKHNTTLVLFVILVASVGFPFQSLPLYDIDVNLQFNPESDLQIVNLFLGNGLVGKSIFDPSTYTHQSMPLAHAVGNGTEPTISLIFENDTSVWVLTVGDSYVEYGAEASDLEDGDLTNNIIIDSSLVDTNTAGVYLTTYNVTDSDGNFVSTERITDVREPVNYMPNNSTQTYFDEAIYQTVEEADPINDVVLGRAEQETVTQIGDRTFKTSKTLLKYLETNENEWVERIINDDVNGVQFESGILSFYYSKSQCGMTLHDTGRIGNDSEIYLKSNGWVVKSALNGTDNWTDMQQNSLPCTVTVTDDDTKTLISSVKEDDKGKFTVEYEIPKPISDMKTTAFFFNNDTALTDHKVAFSNILDTTPEHYRFNLWETKIENGTSFDVPMEQQFSTSPLTAPLQYDQDSIIQINNTEFVDIPRDSFFSILNQNVTDPEIISRNGFSMDYYSPNIEAWIPIEYEFTNDAVDKLWNVRIVNNLYEDNRVFIDYMNNAQVLGFGETAELDPTFNAGFFDLRTVTAFSTAHSGTGSGCRGVPENISETFATTMNWALNVAGGFLNGRFNTCTVPMLTFNVAGIPDDASVLALEYRYNVTSWSMGNNVANHQNWWIMGFEEEVVGLNGRFSGDTIFYGNGEASPEHPNSWLSTNYGGTTDINGEGSAIRIIPTDLANTAGNCLGFVSGSIPCPQHVTYTDPTTITDDFELFLESGQDWLIMSGCNYHSDGANPTGQGSSTARGCDNSFRTSSGVARTNVWTGDPATVELNITWEIFLPASAPQNLTCTINGLNLDLDWSLPADTGGTGITGYTIYRSTGGAFQLQDNIPAVPSDWSDTSGVIAGLQYTYHVHAVNDTGEGAFAEISCGLAGISDPVTTLSLTNQAVGIVALDWIEPPFTGNTPVTGYQIQRTDGAPPIYPDTIQFINHDDITFTINQVVSLTPQTGGASVTGSGARGSNSPTWQSTAYFFQVFAVEDIDGKKIGFDWSGVNRKWITPATSIGCSGGGSARILDGAYTLDNANQPNIGQDFPKDAGIPLKGHGVLQTLATHAIIPNPPHCGGVSSADEGWSFIGFTDTLVLTDPSPAIGATGEFVTLIFSQQMENSQDAAPTMLLENLEIEPIKHWNLNSDVFSTYDPYTAGELGSDCGANGSNNPNTCGIYTAGDTFVVDPLGFEVLVADTGNLQTEYLDATVEPLTSYGYRVIALNSEGESVNGDSNVEIILTAGAPESPDAPSVTATGTTTMTANWNEPNLNNSVLQSYTLERKQGVAGIYQVVQSGSTATSFDDGTGLFTLVPATEYCYRVKVLTNTGESAFSNETCATTFDAPTVPLNLQVTALDGSSVDMSFNTPASDGGSPILGYKIERDIGSGFVTLDSLTLNQFRNDTGLPVGTLVTYRVSASNAFGFGLSVTGSDTTDATPQVPPNFVCSAGTSDTINLSWDTPVTFSPPTGYLISRNVDGGAFSTLVADTASTGTTYNDTPISLDTIYGYKIAGHTSEGDTAFTDEVFCKALSSPDQPPQNFKADFSLSSPHNIILSWDLPLTYGNPVTSIEVQRDDGAGYVELAVLPPNAVGMVDSEPNNDVSQKYRIKIINPSGESNYGYAVPSDLTRVSHFNFENTVDDTGDEKNTSTVTGVVAFDDIGHAGTKGFDYDGASYITVDVAQESDYDFERTTPFGGSLYYEGGNSGGLSFTDEWYAINHRYWANNHQAYTLHVNTGGFNADATGSATNTRGEVILFKVFNATDIDGKTFDIDYNGYHRGVVGACTGSANVVIYDGEYSIADGGTADFPDQAGIVSKGAGFLQTLHTAPACNVGAPSVQNWSFDGISPTVNLASATDPSGKVTLMVRLDDSSSHSNTNGVSPRITVTDIALNKLGGADERIWDFLSTNGGSYTEDVPTSCVWNCGEVISNETSLLGIQALITKAQTLASVGWVFYLDGGQPVFRMNGATQSIEVKSDEFVSTNNLEHLAFTTNGNSTGAGVKIFVGGNETGVTIVTDTLSSESILNNEPLVIGATSTGTNILQSITDEVMIFGENLEDEEVVEIAEDEVQTIAPINATMSLTGSTFADISSETPTITLISGFPLPVISGNLELKNFTATTVNTASGLSMPASGILNVPALFNQMGSTSNYTAIATLDNGLEAFIVISNEDIQNPLFTLPSGIDFFFQQQRINDFEDLSFNFTKTSIPFDLACNLKSELFEDGITYEFENVGFLQEIFDVPRTKDVVVACIDQNSPLLNPDEPSFGGSNALLTFVSFGDTTGIGAFLNFTDNYGDFFGAPLPYLFIILAAALFTGRSAPTGIIVIGVALGIMWYLGLLVIDPVLWGIIVVLIILGAIGGKKFL